MLKYQEPDLVAALERLPPQSRVAFAASCAQRLLQAYRQYCVAQGQPDTAALDNAMEYIWGNILGHPRRETTEELLDDVLTLLPDDRALAVYPLSAYAEDAISAVAYSLRCMLSFQAQEAAWAARHVYEAVDQFVINRDDISPVKPETELRILNDDLVQAELRRQAQDLADLQKTEPCALANLLNVLRERGIAEQAVVVAGQSG